MPPSRSSPLLAGAGAAPALFMASKKMGFPLSPWVSAAAILFSAAAVALSILSLAKGRTDRVKSWGYSGASVLALLFLGLLVAIPVLDPFKTFVPFTSALSTLAPPSRTLYAYKPDETLRGAVPFYTGRPLVEVDSLSALKEALSKEKSLFILIRDRRGDLEGELGAAFPVSVLLRQYRSTDRSLVLLRVTVDGDG